VLEILRQSSRFPECSHRDPIDDTTRVARCQEIYGELCSGLSIFEDPALGPLLRPSDTNAPFQRWFHYREGYTVELCRRIVSRNETLVVDPFCGFGSTLLAAQSAGIPSIGVDVSPLAVFVSTVKTRIYRRRDVAQLKEQIRKLNSLTSRSPSAQPPPLRIIGKLFQPDILRALLIFQRHISGIADPVLRDFFMLGWLAILEKVSNVFREGNGIKYRNRLRNGNDYHVVPYNLWQASHFPRNKFQYVQRELIAQCNMMLEDLVAGDNRTATSVLQADAAALTAVIPKRSASLVLFSPPYCNCFNYIKAYKLELWMAGFIRNYPDIRSLTKMGIRSRVESLLDPVREPYPPVVDKLISLMDQKNLWSEQLPDVIRGYFADIQRCLLKIRDVLKPRGRCVIVVGNSAYAGVLVPSDLLLARIASSLGFEVEKLVVGRHLTTSSQQRRRITPLKDYLRETVIHLRRSK
jgi:hypothetical protein